MEVKEVCKSLTALWDASQEALTQCKAHLSQGSAKTFMASQLNGTKTDLGSNVLFRIAHAYAGEYKRLGITKYAQLEDFCRQNFANAEIQDCVTALDEVEEEWQDFFLNIDKESFEHSDPQTPEVQVGDLFTFASPLIDFDTGEQVSVKSLGGGDKKVLLIFLRHLI
ncbi:uncharacterized protein [Watersipora subatra]|uniref:uncharacterized protein n=1 Tax=Watersipora subatra TaxID=2589382 RepID=UPI00355C9A8E